MRGETLPGVDYPTPYALRHWGEFLEQPETLGVWEQIRACTYARRPLGDEDFIQHLEQRLGKSLERRPRGRPAKNTTCNNV